MRSDMLQLVNVLGMCKDRYILIESLTNRQAGKLLLNSLDSAVTVQSVQLYT